MKCKNEKCSYRLIDGDCMMFDNKGYDMSAEDFIDTNTCGWVEKLEV
jgi:hypothetical protein